MSAPINTIANRLDDPGPFGEVPHARGAAGPRRGIDARHHRLSGTTRIQPRRRTGHLGAGHHDQPGSTGAFLVLLTDTDPAGSTPYNVAGDQFELTRPARRDSVSRTYPPIRGPRHITRPISIRSPRPTSSACRSPSRRRIHSRSRPPISSPRTAATTSSAVIPVTRRSTRETSTHWPRLLFGPRDGPDGQCRHDGLTRPIPACRTT